jgi:indole-3-glycerol phosphate synthase
MATYLDGIVAWHRARAAADERDLGALRAKAELAEPPRPFAGHLVAERRPGSRPALIAEIKRRSPSKGDLAPDLDPVAVARDYEAGGAACLSVLTDGPHFGGSPADLIAARAATSLPALRKDFTVSVADVYDARIMGADAVLVIVAALTDAELTEFVQCATALSLAAVVEVHDAQEARRALAAGATMIGVNQRDLRTFEVDRDRAIRVAEHLPAGTITVAESGIRDGADVARLSDAGYDAVLVGETLVMASDRAAAVRALVSAEAAV